MKTLNNTYATTYTDLKEIKSFCDTHNIDDWKEVTENILSVSDHDGGLYSFFAPLFKR